MQDALEYCMDLLANQLLSRSMKCCHINRIRRTFAENNSEFVVPAKMSQWYIPWESFSPRVRFLFFGMPRIAQFGGECYQQICLTVL